MRVNTFYIFVLLHCYTSHHCFIKNRLYNKFIAVSIRKIILMLILWIQSQSVQIIGLAHDAVTYQFYFVLQLTYFAILMIYCHLTNCCGSLTTRILEERVVTWQKDICFAQGTIVCFWAAKFVAKPLVRSTEFNWSVQDWMISQKNLGDSIHFDFVPCRNGLFLDVLLKLAHIAQLVKPLLTITFPLIFQSPLGSDLLLLDNCLQLS